MDWRRTAVATERGALLLVPPMLASANGVADALCASIAVLFLVRSILTRDFGWLGQRWLQLFLVLWAYLCVRSLVSVQPLHSFAYALVWIRFLIFAVAVSRCMRDPLFRDRFAWVLVASFLFLSIDGVLQYLSGWDIVGRHREVDGRITGPFSRPHVGITVAWLFLPPLLWLAQRGRWLIAGLFGSAALLVITVSGERMALLTLVIDLVALVLLMPTWRRGILIATLAAGVLMAGVFVARPPLLERQVYSIGRSVSGVRGSTYGLVWERAAQIAAAFPVFGLGVDNYRVVCQEPSFGPVIAPDQNSRCTTHPHNFWLEWLLSGGVLALVVYIAAVAFLFVDLGRNLRFRNAVFAGLFATLIMRLWPISTNTSFFHSWSAIPLFLYVGWALSCLPQDDAPPARTPRPVNLQ